MPNRPAPEINGDLLLDTPGGGRIHLVGDGRLVTVNCSDERALRDILGMVKGLYPNRLSMLGLLRTPNPLSTTITLVEGKSKKLLIWHPGRYPKIKSIWSFIRAFF